MGLIWNLISMNINSNIVFVTSSIPYVLPTWKQRTCHYFLRGCLLQIKQCILLHGIKKNEHIITDHKNDLDQILLYGKERYDYDTNRMILLCTAKFSMVSNSNIFFFYFLLI